MWIGFSIPTWLLGFFSGKILCGFPPMSKTETSFPVFSPLWISLLFWESMASHTEIWNETYFDLRIVSCPDPKNTMYRFRMLGKCLYASSRSSPRVGPAWRRLGIWESLDEVIWRRSARSTAIGSPILPSLEWRLSKEKDEEVSFRKWVVKVCS